MYKKKLRRVVKAASNAIPGRREERSEGLTSTRDGSIRPLSSYIGARLNDHISAVAIATALHAWWGEVNLSSSLQLAQWPQVRIGEMRNEESCADGGQQVDTMVVEDVHTVNVMDIFAGLFNYLAGCLVAPYYANNHSIDVSDENKTCYM